MGKVELRSNLRVGQTAARERVREMTRGLARVHSMSTTTTYVQSISKFFLLVCTDLSFETYQGMSSGVLAVELTPEKIHIYMLQK